MTESTEFELFRSAADEEARDRAKAAFVTHLVSLATGVPADEIISAPRGRNGAARARSMAIYLSHVAFALPQRRVATAFRRDPTTVGQALARIEAMREEGSFDRLVDDLEACVRQAPAEIQT